jgi:hypothetical protein
MMSISVLPEGFFGVGAAAFGAPPPMAEVAAEVGAEVGGEGCFAGRGRVTAAG